MKTIICDIDGCLVEQNGHYANRVSQHVAFKMLPGTIDKFLEWDRKAYKILLITARKESSRKQTEKMLSDLGIFYDVLVMGMNTGQRVLINDLKPDSDIETAVAINLPRNKGVSGIDV